MNMIVKYTILREVHDSDDGRKEHDSGGRKEHDSGEGG
jgi:hypothetical protein